MSRRRIAKAFESQFSDAPPTPGRDGGGPHLWVVVHGYGRGRSSPFPAVFLSHLSSRRHPLLLRLRVHYTGDTSSPAFERGDVILFWLGDPLERLYPECYADAVALEACARAVGARVLNPPEALSRTSKLTQSATWRSAGVPSAQGWGFASQDELVAALPTLPMPLIVRYDFGHSQQGMYFCRTHSEVEALLPKLQFPLTALEFVDTRTGTWSNPVYSQYFHKKRAFVFCDTVINSHVFFSTAPLVSLSTCTFTRQARWNGRLARAVGLGRSLLAKTVAADKAFFEDPADEPGVLRAGVRALGLDIAAVDYAIAPGRGVILWEANPYFHLPHGNSSVLSRERDAVRRVDQTFDALAGALERVLSGAEMAAVAE